MSEQATGAQLDTVVEFRCVGFTYGNRAEGAALYDINLRIPRGQCVVFTGASGCGKTTLTRMINGLIPAVYVGIATGQVLVEGRAMDAWEMDELSCQVGSVFQNPRSQFFNLDTTSEIAFGCENMGLPRDEIRRRVHAAVADLGIEHLLERDIRMLSGGERQMVALASAYALGPDIFVLDEPTASLDVDAMRQLARVVTRLRAAGKTVIVAEHRLWWLADVVDRVVLMEEGRIAHDWTSAEFGALSADERDAFGLRAWDVVEVHCHAMSAPADASSSSAAASLVTDASSRHAMGAPVDASSRHALALEVSALRAGYGRTPVLRGVNMSILPGHIVGLVGCNGAGKTTFSRCIAGLHKESAGTVALAGATLSWRARAGVAYLVMQETGYQLFADSVVHELEQACANGAHLRDVRKRAANVALAQAAEGVLDVTTLLDRFGLVGLEDRHPLSLSGGERQRLAIAAGVAQGMQFMVLDEPTSGLDAKNMRRVAAELARLRQAGMSALVVTHDFEFLCKACDAVAEIDAGVIHARYDLSEETLPRVRALFGFE